MRSAHCSRYFNSLHAATVCLATCSACLHFRIRNQLVRLALHNISGQCRSALWLIDHWRWHAAEDSGNHENNVAWYYDLETQTLARYFSSPIGAEVVSPFFYPNINGFAYIVTGAQHPFAGQEDRLCAS